MNEDIYSEPADIQFEEPTTHTYVEASWAEYMEE